MAREREIKKVKAQSAMEYLTTYGWALLLIAIIFILLYKFGVFQPQYPTTSAGGCRIYRPTSGVPSLLGACNNLPPAYMMGFPGGSDCCALAAYLNVPNRTMMRSIVSNDQVSISGWMYYFGPAPGDSEYMGGNYCGPAVICAQNNGFEVDFNPGGSKGGNPTLVASEFTVNGNQIGFFVPTYSWYMVTAAYNGNSGIATVWLNGSVVATQNIGKNLDLSSNCYFLMGDSCFSSLDDSFNGIMSNIQLYNVSLSAGDVKSLYNKGIGGSPANLQNVVGWWPLNGNPVDYGGNGYTGNVVSYGSSIVFMSNWRQSSYYIT